MEEADIESVSRRSPHLPIELIIHSSNDPIDTRTLIPESLQWLSTALSRLRPQTH